METDLEFEKKHLKNMLLALNEARGILKIKFAKSIRF